MRSQTAVLCTVLCVLLLFGLSGCLGQSLSLSDIAKRYDDGRTDPIMTKDKDVGRDAYELIVSKGYRAERHSVKTEDGYILGMIRIVGTPNDDDDKGEEGPCPGSGRKPPVLLQHGLIDSCATWVMNMPNQSLGFVLADLGYDVWLGNNRGNSYSQKHESLEEGFDAWEKDFWDFSWQEMAEYDLPAEINYILEETGSDHISYIGHSQGTTQAFAAFSLPEFRDLARKVRVHIALAPVAYVGNTESLGFQAAAHLDVARNLAQIPELQVFMNQLLGTGTGADLLKSLIPTLCDTLLGDCDKETGGGEEFHDGLFNSGMMGSLFGLPDMKHLNQSRIPVYLAHMPEGTSIRNLIHWSQAVKSKKFRKFDVGSCPSTETCPNTYKYGQGYPPDYDLSNYRVPTVLISGSKDPISNRKDVRKLVGELAETPGVLVRSKELSSYDHNDFTISIDGNEIFFPLLVDYLEEYTCDPRDQTEVMEASEARGKPNADANSKDKNNFSIGAFVEDSVSGIASAASVEAEAEAEAASPPGRLGIPLFKFLDEHLGG